MDKSEIYIVPFIDTNAKNYYPKMANSILPALRITRDGKIAICAYGSSDSKVIKIGSIQVSQ